MSLPKARVIVLAGYQRSLILFRKSLLSDMVDQGHTVVACAPESDASIIAQLKRLGVRYQTIPCNRSSLDGWSDLRALWRLWDLFSRERPDVVLAYTIKPVIYGSLAAHWAGIPRVYAMITGLGQAFTRVGMRGQLLNALVMKLYQFALKSMTAVFFQNPSDRDYFRRRRLVPAWCPTILVNGSGVDLDEFVPAPWPSSPCAFLLLARLIAEKGVREYVEAARFLKKRYPQTIFRLAGFLDPRPGSITTREIEGWAKEGLIEYLGCLDDVRPALRASSVYVLPSYYPEGIPHSILEAMAMGRPIVTTNQPGCRQTVHEGVNGFLIPARSPERLAQAMETFIRHPSLIAAMGRESRLRAEADYDVRQVNHTLLQNMGLEPFPASGSSAPAPANSLLNNVIS